MSHSCKQPLWQPIANYGRLSLMIILAMATFSSIPAFAKLTAEDRAIMAKHQASLQKMQLAKKAKQQGDDAIMFRLPNAQGKKIDLAEELKKGKVILSFYRGGWCPYCNEQLQMYQKHLKKIQAAGARLIAISPDSPQSEQDTIAANEIEFQVLSDKDNRIARQYGLVFDVSEDLQKVYKKLGLDLEKYQGSDKWQLPLPATYVINGAGKIIYSFVDEDYKKRAPIKEVLHAVKR